MKEIKYTTKEAEKYIKMYWNAKKSDLSQYYKRPGNNKIVAQAQCRQKMELERGFNFRIISHSHFFFSCGWLTPEGHLRIETPTNSIIVKNVIHIPY